MRNPSRLHMAILLDRKFPWFNFSAKTGPTSYKRYTRNEIIRMCVAYGIDIYTPVDLQLVPRGTSNQ